MWSVLCSLQIFAISAEAPVDGRRSRCYNLALLYRCGTQGMGAECLTRLVHHCIPNTQSVG